jgi:MFS family permease
MRAIHPAEPRLGLRANIGQFSLLVVVNAFVGSMVGLERSILPAIADQEFHLAARSAILSFIVVFGIAKAVTNYAAGRLSDSIGRKKVLVAGWIVAVPVPFLLMWAPTWNWILIANCLLGVSQGLAWSTTLNMKIDLAGPSRRGLATGLNEFAGYGAVSLTALLTAYIATAYGLRPDPFYPGVIFVAAGLFLSIFLVRDTHKYVQRESRTLVENGFQQTRISHWEIFKRASVTDASLSSLSQAGLVKNLNDGMAWGLFPLLYAAVGLSLSDIGWLAGIYPAVWGIGQSFTGPISDRIGRKWLIAAGMWVQALGIATIAVRSVFSVFLFGAVLLGVGAAMVYPTLPAAVGDIAQPTWRAGAIGVYRFWRDLGYAIGAVLAGATADAFGARTSIWLIAALTFASGLAVVLRMRGKQGMSVNNVATFDRDTRPV